MRPYSALRSFIAFQQKIRTKGSELSTPESGKRWPYKTNCMGIISSADESTHRRNCFLRGLRWVPRPTISPFRPYAPSADNRWSLSAPFNALGRRPKYLVSIVPPVRPLKYAAPISRPHRWYRIAAPDVGVCKGLGGQRKPDCASAYRRVRIPRKHPAIPG